MPKGVFVFCVFTGITSLIERGGQGIVSNREVYSSVVCCTTRVIGC